MQAGSGYQGHVQRVERVAIVHEGLVVERRDRETFLLVSGQNLRKEELERDIARIDFPRVEIGASILRRVIRYSFRK